MGPHFSRVEPLQFYFSQREINRAIKIKLYSQLTAKYLITHEKTSSIQRTKLGLTLYHTTLTFNNPEEESF